MSSWHNNSLRLTNALIGLTQPDDSWPSPLAGLGYRVLWLERKLTGSAGECQADVVMNSVAANHALVFEVKCGSLQTGQHASYLALTETDMRDGGVPDSGGTAFSFDVAYATGIDCAETLAVGLEQYGVMPLVVFDDESISGTLQPFTDEDVEMVFGGVVNTADMTPPMSYVTFNDESTDLDIITVLLSAILASLRRGDAQLPIEDLIRAAMPFWVSFSQHYRTALSRRVEGLVSRNAKHFAEFFDYVGADVPHRIVMKADLSNLPDERCTMPSADGMGLALTA